MINSRVLRNQARRVLRNLKKALQILYRTQVGQTAGAMKSDQIVEVLIQEAEEDVSVAENPTTPPPPVLLWNFWVNPMERNLFNRSYSNNLSVIIDGSKIPTI